LRDTKNPKNGQAIEKSRISFLFLEALELFDRGFPMKAGPGEAAFSGTR
jgi:hypothetical protein